MHTRAPRIGAAVPLGITLAILAVAWPPGTAQALSRTDLILLPLAPQTPALSISDPATSTQLDLGTHYQFSATWAGAPNSFFNNGSDSAAEIEPFEISFSFLDFPTGEPAATPQRLLFVITSLRSNTPNPQDPDFPLPIDAGFVPGSFLQSDGTTPLTTLIVFDDDSGDGQIHPSEGTHFLAIEFDPIQNSAQAGSFEIGFLSPLNGSSFSFYHSAFLVEQSVPEPASGLLLVLAVVGLRLSRGRVTKV